MGGVTKPSTSLVKLPAPGQMYPGVSNQYQGMLQTQGPQTGQTLGEAMRTGMPTDVGPAFQSMVDSRQRGMQQGQNNILEAYGASGNRYGSGIQNSLVDYQLQGQKDLSQILADYTRQAQESAAGRRVGSAQFGASLMGDAATTTYPTAALSSGASGLSQGAQAAQAAAQVAMMIAML